ncbi:unnamed protein product [Trichogramma brassicae]|uniref:Cyclin-dependent kinase 20 n=1 Tax=Trichogramma brassicae TaxID=86971 RepID=A0A6H5I0E6_9HYME|nr:unnamed protein product [Trichogramma brassicae]
MHRYTISGKIGEGAHGVVLKGLDKSSSTPRPVALKRILLKRIDDGIPISVLREVKTLQRLKHPYIVELLDAFPAGLDFVMVFEYMPSGLWELLKDYDRPLTDSQIKTYMRMLLEGVAYMHSNNIMHRDLKPANLLIREDGVLTIADFGLGRLMWQDISRPYSHQVATRWYRAPELLYGARFYTAAVDMWAVGCIFGEMLNNSPIFPGESDIEQLAIVLSHLGSPTAESWPELSSLPDYNKITFPYHKGVLWERMISDAQPEAIELVKAILIYDSSKRLTAQQVYHRAVIMKRDRGLNHRIIFHDLYTNFAQALRYDYFYSKPYPCLESELVKPPSDHRARLKPKEVETDLKPSALFKNLSSILTEKNACAWSQNKIRELFTNVVIKGDESKSHRRRRTGIVNFYDYYICARPAAACCATNRTSVASKRRRSDETEKFEALRLMSRALFRPINARSKSLHRRTRRLYSSSSSSRAVRVRARETESSIQRSGARQRQARIYSLSLARRKSAGVERARELFATVQSRDRAQLSSDSFCEKQSSRVRDVIELRVHLKNRLLKLNDPCSIKRAKFLRRCFFAGNNPYVTANLKYLLEFFVNYICNICFIFFVVTSHRNFMYRKLRSNDLRVYCQKLFFFFLILFSATTSKNDKFQAASIQHNISTDLNGVHQQQQQQRRIATTSNNNNNDNDNSSSSIKRGCIIIVDIGIGTWIRWLGAGAAGAPIDRNHPKAAVAAAAAAATRNGSNEFEWRRGDSFLARDHVPLRTDRCLTKYPRSITSAESMGSATADDAVMASRAVVVVTALPLGGRLADLAENDEHGHQGDVEERHESHVDSWLGFFLLGIWRTAELLLVPLYALAERRAQLLYRLG